ncbi:hypothetical protein ACQ4M3_04910 [Leptolyngbya sp. AN03gr2]|uniref:hypothetical protein n=1 Tax=unclassified Leptolyngbya TaxID=2650499 RepID=UPI003D323743
MSSSASKSQSKSVSVQSIVFAEILLAVAALLFFLLFSVPDPGQARPDWYSYGASAFEVIAFFSAALLCFRNWNSPQIVSGRRVWLGIGLGMLCYGMGTILFTFWETYLGREADVSLGDFFYVPTYLFLSWGMIMAFADRRLNLDLWQWVTVGAIAAVSIAFATWLTLKPDTPTAFLLGEPAIAQTAPTKPTPRATISPTVRPSPVITPAATPKPAPVVEQKKPEPAKVDNAPEWVKLVEDALAPLKPFLDYFYVLADVFILIIATTLLLAFWGGRFSQSWRMIAAAAFCLYIADMWFKYATTRLENYQSGGLVEIFWIFSGVLFGIGAALEYDLSRSRRGGSRRRA